MKKIVLLIALLVGCVDDDATRDTLQKSGYTEIETLGYDAWTCGKDDDGGNTKFRAKNPRGEVVEGTVCCGLFAKGCTIRF